MFAAAIFPLADLRPFCPSETGRVRAPDWLDAPADGAFLRGFGQLERRPRGGVADWAAEDTFARCRGAIRLQWSSPDSGALGLTAPFVLRRFFSDGRCINRVEVALEFDLDTTSSSDARELLHRLLRLPVRVRGRGAERVECQLGDAGEHLASHLLLSTTSTRFPATGLQPWWVQAGDPILVLEHDPESEPIDVHGASEIKFSSDLAVQPFLYRGKDFQARAWLLGAGRDANDEQTRNLRISLVRLHVERECLRHVLRRVERGDLDVQADAAPTGELQAFLDRRIKLLTRQSLNGIEITPILAFAEEHADLLADVSGATVLERLESVRRNVKHLVKQQVAMEQSRSQGATIYQIDNVETLTMTTNTKTITLGAGATVQGNVVAADTIQDSFNQIANSNVSPELKSSLEDLHKAVAAMTAQLPDDEAGLAARDLDDLTKEALSPTPRKAWWQRAADGLLAVAKNVADVGTPVVALIAKILPLLA